MYLVDLILFVTFIVTLGNKYPISTLFRTPFCVYICMYFFLFVHCVYMSQLCVTVTKYLTQGSYDIKRSLCWFQVQDCQVQGQTAHWFGPLLNVLYHGRSPVQSKCSYNQTESRKRAGEGKAHVFSIPNHIAKNLRIIYKVLQSLQNLSWSLDQDFNTFTFREYYLYSNYSSMILSF